MSEPVEVDGDVTVWTSAPFGSMPPPPDFVEIPGPVAEEAAP